MKTKLAPKMVDHYKKTFGLKLLQILSKLMSMYIIYSKNPAFTKEWISGLEKLNWPLNNSALSTGATPLLYPKLLSVRFIKDIVIFGLGPSCIFFKILSRSVPYFVP